jgi:hypothetical protein
MILSFNFKIYSMSFFRRVVGSKPDSLAINLNLRSKAIPIYCNSSSLCRVRNCRAASVLLVNLVSHITQIAPRIIGRVAVNVVNFIRRPYPCNHAPNDAMSLVIPVVNVDLNPSIWVCVSSDRTGKATTGRGFASKNASFVIVIQEFAQSLRSQFLFHALVLYQRTYHL